MSGLTTDVCVIGGGPAGATLAARLAQLGHDVIMIERGVFPRRHVGESLTPGVRTLLVATGAEALVEEAGGTTARSTRVDWDRPTRARTGSQDSGVTLVDRGEFDRLLLGHAAAAGVRVLQPMTARAPVWRDGAWSIPADSVARTVEVRAKFLAQANGRSACTRARRRRAGPSTVALYAYWTSRRPPEQPRIEAGDCVWYWGVPLPCGAYNLQIFVDRAELRARRGESLEALYRRLARRSSLFAELTDACLDSPIRAIDATAYLDPASASARHIKIGDAALAVDPISSSGVQKALHTAVTGAVVVNTLLRRQEDTELATTFYNDSLVHAFERHAAWAAAQYARVAPQRPALFWQSRATASTPAVAPEVRRPDSHVALVSRAAVRLSASCEFVDMPCADGNYITRKAALRHPAVAGPLAFLGGWELVPLLREIPPGTTPLSLAQRWAARIPARSAVAMIGWLLERGVLELAGSMLPGREELPHTQ